MRPSDGYTEIKRHLVGLQAARDREHLTHLVVVADGDENPAQRFSEIQSFLATAQFAVPATPFVVSDGSPVVGVYLMPGPGRIGALETLLTEAMLDNDPLIGHCLSEFRTCANTPGPWSAARIGKMQVNAAIAMWCRDDPACSVTWIWRKQPGLIPADSLRFQDFCDFVNAVRERTPS